MNLYLVRHGDALPETMDPYRSLSPQGKQETLQVAKMIKSQCVGVSAIWHSEKKRAEETAKIIAEQIGRPNICQEKKGLDPNDAPQAIFGGIQDVAKQRRDAHLMIVGHIPFLGVLTSLLMTSSPALDMVNFPTSGVLCMESHALPIWRIRWMVNPNLCA